MEPQTQRKLAAILMADVVGYSRLMSGDDAATVRTLKACREVFASIVERHRGRVVNAPGDSVLAEFGSVVEGVAAAVAIQQRLAEDNRRLPEDRRMHFRIGINLGDVVVEDGALYGDGVNVAARLEALAEPGGIWVSRNAFDQVDGKLPVAFEYMGEHSVKNFDKPVRAYRVDWEKSSAPAERLADSASAVVEASVLPLPEQPSIAVLPFANMSGDPEQEYFADGITEDIITDLSRHDRLLVIARNSAFTYKGRSVDLRQVGKELGVRHILEGSVRKSGNRVRVTAQLIEAATGKHAWADRYDRPIEDIFAVQDEISHRIVDELDVKLLSGEQAREWRPTTGDLKAYECFLRGHNARMRYNKEDNALARRLALQATELDPDYSAAWADVAASHIVDLHSGWGDSKEESAQQALDLAHRAVALNESNGYAHSVLGLVLYLTAQHDSGMEHAKRGFELNPQSAFSLQVLALLHGFSGSRKGEELIEKARRLDPFPPITFLVTSGVIRWGAGKLDDAIDRFEAVLAETPEHVIAQLLLTASLIETGRIDEARTRASEVRRSFPDTTVADIANIFQDGDLRQRFVSALREAGLE